MDLLCGTNMEPDNSDDSDVGGTIGGGDGGGIGSNNSLPQGPHSGGSGPLNDHDDHESTIGPYLTPSESKLFATAAASGFNFSMAALAADPSALGGNIYLPHAHH